MHTYMLAELGTNKPSSELPPIHEDFIKRSYVNEQDTFIVERILDKKGCKVVRLLVKWLDYQQPMSEPISAIPRHLIPKEYGGNSKNNKH